MKDSEKLFIAGQNTQNSSTASGTSRNTQTSSGTRRNGPPPRRSLPAVLRVLDAVRAGACFTGVAWTGVMT
ncbi:hypothetical protein GCM10009608_80150 [Pseudonocardia alaniniphila]